MGRVPLPPDRTLRRRLEVGHRIRRERKLAHLSQEKLAELAGIDRKTVSRIETGTMAVKLDHLLDLADALEIPPARLLPGGPEPPSAT